MLKLIETRIIYILLGASLAWAGVITWFMRKSVYRDTEFLFHSYIVEEEFQKDMNRRVEAAVYRVQEIEKQKEKINAHPER